MSPSRTDRVKRRRVKKRRALRAQQNDADSANLEVLSPGNLAGPARLRRHRNLGKTRPHRPNSVTKTMSKYLGFENIGNSCYMNSMLQGLFANDFFTRDLYLFCKKTEDSGVNLAEEMPLSIAIVSLVTRRHRPAPLLKRKLLEIIKDEAQFSDFQQQDAQEFLLNVLNKIHAECEVILRTRGVENEKECAEQNPVTANFSFVIQSTIACVGCECVTENSEESIVLPLMLEQPTSSMPAEEPPTIQTLLNAYLKPEILEKTCSVCGFTQARRDQKFTRIPRCIIVFIKRYVFVAAEVVKRNDTVYVPWQLTLYGHCAPYFENFPEVAEEIKQINIESVELLKIKGVVKIGQQHKDQLKQADEGILDKIAIPKTALTPPKALQPCSVEGNTLENFLDEKNGNELAVAAVPVNAITQLNNNTSSPNGRDGNNDVGIASTEPTYTNPPNLGNFQNKNYPNTNHNVHHVPMDAAQKCHSAAAGIGCSETKANDRDLFQNLYDETGKIELGKRRGGELPNQQSTAPDLMIHVVNRNPVSNEWPYLSEEAQIQLACERSLKDMSGIHYDTNETPQRNFEEPQGPESKECSQLLQELHDVEQRPQSYIQYLKGAEMTAGMANNKNDQELMEKENGTGVDNRSGTMQLENDGDSKECTASGMGLLEQQMEIDGDDTAQGAVPVVIHPEAGDNDFVIAKQMAESTAVEPAENTFMVDEMPKEGNSMKIQPTQDQTSMTIQQGPQENVCMVTREVAEDTIMNTEQQIIETHPDAVDDIEALPESTVVEPAENAANNDISKPGVIHESIEKQIEEVKGENCIDRAVMEHSAVSECPVHKNSSHDKMEITETEEQRKARLTRELEKFLNDDRTLDGHDAEDKCGAVGNLEVANSKAGANAGEPAFNAMEAENCSTNNYGVTNPMPEALKVAGHDGVLSLSEAVTNYSAGSHHAVAPTPEATTAGGHSAGQYGAPLPEAVGNYSTSHHQAIAPMPEIATVGGHYGVPPLPEAVKSGDYSVNGNHGSGSVSNVATMEQQNTATVESNKFLNASEAPVESSYITEYTHVSLEHPLVNYTPLDEAKRYEICLLLDLPQIALWMKETPVDVMSAKDKPASFLLMEGNNNCLFHALAFYVSGNQADFPIFREAIIQYEVCNAEKFMALTNWTREYWDQHMEMLNASWEWGGTLEIYAFATMFNVGVWVFWETEWLSFEPQFTEAEFQPGGVTMPNDNCVYLLFDDNKFSPVYEPSNEMLSINNDFVENVRRMTHARAEGHQGLAKPAYRLISVVKHVGEKPDSGHYTCDVWHNMNWLHCSDKAIDGTNESKVMTYSDSGYVYMYLNEDVLKK